MAYTTAQVNAWYQSVQFRDGPTATVNSYVSLLNSGAITSSQVQNAVIQDSYTFANVNSVIRLYQGAFNRVPDQAGENYWADIMGATPDAQKSAQLQTIATGFANSTEFVATYGVNASAPINGAVITAFYANILNRAPDTAGYTYWLNSGLNVGQVLNSFAQSAEFTTASSNAIVLYQQAEIAGNGATSGSLFQYGGFPGTTFVLTTGLDTQTANTFLGIVGGGNGVDTWNTGDTLTGAQLSGNSLKLNDVGADELTTAEISPVGASLTNIQNLNITTPNSLGTNVAGISTAGALFNSLTNVTSTATGVVNFGAGSAQTVNITNSAQGITNTLIGGAKSVILTTTAVAGAADTGAITVGGAGTTGAIGAGAISIVSNMSAGDTQKAGAIATLGGSTVSITQNALNATVNTTNTLGSVAVDGTANTTSVTVSQTAKATAAASVVGVTNGIVTIRDATAIAGTAATNAGTISTVTLNNYANSTISSNALATLNLSGTAGTLGITTGLTTPTKTTLALNVNGLSGTNTITDSTAAAGGNGYTVINLTGATAASTIANIAAVDVTTLNVAGTQAITLTSTAGLTGLTTVSVTGSAGLAADLSGATVTSINASGTSGNITAAVDGTKATYTGGSGVDTITITASPTLAISGGAGTADVIVNNAATDVVANNSNITGFEILGAGTLATGTLAATGFTGLQVKGNTAGAITFSNVAAGTTLTLGARNNSTTYTLANATGSSDVLNLSLSSTGAIDANTVVAAGIETVNITTLDLDATAHQDTLAVQATSATTINVSGAAGLAFTNTGNTKVALFDASGINGADANAASLAVTYTSATTTANSATTTIKGGSGNDTLTGGATADTILGNAGNDSIAGLTGADTIDGGLGTNTFLATSMVGANIEGAGTGTATGAVINLGSTALTNSAVLAATGFNLAGSLSSVASNTTAYLYANASNSNSAIQDTLANIQNATGSTGGDYIVGSSAANVISGLQGADTLTGGLGADTFVQNASGLGFAATGVPSTASFSTGGTFTLGSGVDVITDFTAAQGDLLDTQGTSVVNFFGLASSTDVGSAENGFIRGTYDTATSVFTIASGGADVLIAPDVDVASADFGASTSLILLVGYNANPTSSIFV